MNCQSFKGNGRLIVTQIQQSAVLFATFIALNIFLIIKSAAIDLLWTIKGEAFA
jgi:hypothetical protein